MKRNIYIDGENFVHIVVNCLIEQKVIQSRKQLDNFDFKYLLDFVTRTRPARASHVRYYGAKLNVVTTNPTLKKLSQGMVQWNARWVNVLGTQNVQFIKCGHLKVRDGHKCQHCGRVDQVFLEKGVDVGMAVDIVSDALNRTVDEIVLFSADSDMLPAVKRAHGAGIRVIYAAYTGAMNRALTTMVDDIWTYSADQIVAAYKRTKNS